MLAVFEKTAAKCPEGLQCENPEKVCALKDGSLCKHFSSVHPNAVTINFAQSASFSFSADNHNPLLPRMFEAVDKMFYLFEGHIDNVGALKQQYGLNKMGNEVNIIIEAYRSLRDRGPYPIDQVVKGLHGKFVFILYDFASNIVFLAADADGSVPFFWGADSEGNLVLSDDEEMVKKGCGNSFAPFPKGCFFTSSGGLRNFEHPRNGLKAVPRVGSSGQIYGANFTVDADSKIEPVRFPRNGSSADFSSDY